MHNLSAISQTQYEITVTVSKQSLRDVRWLSLGWTADLLKVQIQTRVQCHSLWFSNGISQAVLVCHGHYDRAILVTKTCPSCMVDSEGGTAKWRLSISRMYVINYGKKGSPYIKENKLKS